MSQHYQTKEDIVDLKYSTGDWGYQCFSSINVFSEDELTKILENFPEDNYKSWKKFVEELIQSFTKSIADFSKTRTFEKISKTDNFKFFCIDHDENIEEVEKRIKK